MPGLSTVLHLKRRQQCAVTIMISGPPHTEKHKGTRRAPHLLALVSSKKSLVLRLTPPAKRQSEGVIQYTKICETNATKATGISLKSPWNKDSEYLRQSSRKYFGRTCQHDETRARKRVVVALQKATENTVPLLRIIC